MWLTHSLTVPGRSHTTSSGYKARAEDAANTWRTRDAAVLAVADGLGSYARAADASSLALAIAQTVTAPHCFLTGSVRETHTKFKQVMAQIRDEFHQAIGQTTDPDQWKTTLALALVTEEIIFYASVGDSFLALRHDDLPGNPDEPGRLVLVDQPTRRGESDSAAATLHDDLGLARVYAFALTGLTGVFLSTDGLERFIRPQPKIEQAFYLDSIFSRVVDLVAAQRFAAAAAGLSHSEIRDRKGDDIGVAMATRG